MFSSAFLKDKSNVYHHYLYEDFTPNHYNNEDDIEKYEIELKIHKEQMNKKLEITDELVEKLKNYDTIIFGNNFNSPIDNLPDNIKKISWLNSYFDKPILKFPINLEILDFSGLIWENNFENLDICVIPNSVKVIKTLISNINLPNLPLDLEILQITGEDFQKYYKILKPLKKIKKLIIGERAILLNDTELNLNMLPSSLEILSIYFAKSFELENLPTGLKKLRIETVFSDFSLDILPSSLEELYIGCRKYNNPIDMLPCGLKKITLESSQFNKMLSFPDNLEILILKLNPSKMGLITLPKNLKNLNLGVLLLPNEILVFESKIKLLNNGFPTGLLNLTITTDFLSNDIVLPEYLVSLKILNGDIVIHEIPEFSFELPNSLKYLNIGRNINFKFINMPESLECLYLNDSFNLELPEFPKSLRLLYFDVHGYTHKLPKFNEGLKHLYLSYFNSIPGYEILDLPDSLESLYLKYIIKDYFVFPPNLKYFGYNPYYNLEPNSKEVKDLNDYYKNNEELDCNVIEFNNKLLSSMPDSVEIFSTNIDINKYSISRLPANLKEIGVYNRELTNSGFDYIKYFIDCGCTNNFSDIILYLVEDGSDIKYYNYRIREYFNHYEKYEYNYNYDYNYEI
jgi:hypothetical protein